VSAPIGYFVSAAGYEQLAALARSKGDGWRGVERYLMRRAHEAAVAAEREKVTALSVIEGARRDVLAEYKAICAELDADEARVDFFGRRAEVA
jgi:hypothetical protein